MVVMGLRILHVRGHCISELVCSVHPRSYVYVAMELNKGVASSSLLFQWPMNGHGAVAAVFSSCSH